MMFAKFTKAATDKTVYINVDSITHYMEEGNDGTRETTHIWVTSGEEIVVSATASMVHDAIFPRGGIAGFADVSI